MYSLQCIGLCAGEHLVHCHVLLTEIAVMDTLLHSHWCILHFFKCIPDFLL